MKKTSPKRLILHRETLAHLDELMLANVQGQFLSAYQSCEVPCATNYTVCYGSACKPL
ncbi:MAG TPA: hypothetical protein VFE33_27935 [Thermoanaerobaculia bacterium]|nr:hypothetical protein [Thermoanaerobaculia bacterium]